MVTLDSSTAFDNVNKYGLLGKLLGHLYGLLGQLLDEDVPFEVSK